jgi:triacylglycerol lipase
MTKSEISKERCATVYPIVLAHGVGYKDFSFFGYWGRIPKELEREGARVFFGHQDGWGTIEHNAHVLKKSIESVLETQKCAKVNIIAHSKGGLEARYLITRLGLYDKVASLTTIATPHNGSKTMDVLCKLPPVLFIITSFLVNSWWRLLKDEKPDFHAACVNFTTLKAKAFNDDTPDAEGVYYQSYACVMKSPLSDLLMLVPNIVISMIEGPNDGLVTPQSAKWTNFRGELYGASLRGISHLDEIDFRRRPLAKKVKDGFVSDITDAYADIAAQLKSMGF